MGLSLRWGDMGAGIFRAVGSGDCNTCILQILNHLLARRRDDDDIAQLVIRRLALPGRGGCKQFPIARGFSTLPLACGNHGLCQVKIGAIIT